MLMQKKDGGLCFLYGLPQIHNATTKPDSDPVPYMDYILDWKQVVHLLDLETWS